jgi:hypothetical protein
MTDLDSKARVAAAYREIDKELRRRKLKVIWACIAAVLLLSAFVLYFYGTLPVGPAVRRPGTVIRTMQVADDTAHDVRLVVALDRGPSILLPAVGVVPIGARVVVGERRNRLGWPRYAFIGRESESKGE